jgi:hypothetical protein
MHGRYIVLLACSVINKDRSVMNLADKRFFAFASFYANVFLASIYTTLQPSFSFLASLLMVPSTNIDNISGAALFEPYQYCLKKKMRTPFCFRMN